MRTGTCHFYRVIDAIEYYEPQGISENEVWDKLKEKEIVIGAPPYNPKTEYLSQERGRYFVNSNLQPI